MDHLPWNESTTLDRIRVPYVCRDRPCQSNTSDEFKGFPQSQGWELDESESLAQLAERAQAWLFFGLLSIAGVSPDSCIDRDGDLLLVNTKMIPNLLCFELFTVCNKTEIKVVAHYDNIETRVKELINTIAKATDVMLTQVIPLLRRYEALDPIDLWSSEPFAILFSIDVLLDTMKFRIWKSMTAILPSVARQSKVTGGSSISKQTSTSDPLCLVDYVHTAFTKAPGTVTLFPKLTQGVARSLLRTGRCGSLVQRLDLTSSGFYSLISLPTTTSLGSGDEGECYGEEHTQCSATSCSCFNINEATYRPRHTKDCVMCDGLEVDESDLVDLIRRHEVPVIQSTMDCNGRVSIRVQKMTEHLEYTAISHVWAGGLGNFQRNQLPQCQLESMHRDVCRTMARASSDFFEAHWKSSNFFEVHWQSAPDRVKAFLSWVSGTTTCYYWMDTLCIPINHPAERKEAINSMGRVYAGAGAVLVLDPALSSIALHDNELAGKDQGRAVNMLVQASPWMARSWPLQEAALASGPYIKFANRYIRYDHERLSMAVTLDAIHNQWSVGLRLSWLKHCWFDPDEDEEIEDGRVLPYKPGTDFVKVWNLLSKRTTSYSVDVPAIFAALLYRSAGEILAIDPAHRTWSLLGSVDCLPADILCIELEEPTGQPHPQQPQQWMPRLPGSSRPVMSLNPMFGSLQRIASGFVLQMQYPSTSAIVCRKSFPMASGGHFVMRKDGQKPFLIHLREPTNGPNINSTTTTAIEISKGKSISRSPLEETEEEESQLILLFRKRAPGSLLENCAVLFKINNESEDKGKLRVQFLSNCITWRLLSEREQQQPLSCETRDYVSVDTSSSILIEMDTQHWPILAWSRFNAYPYQHFLAQAFQCNDIDIILVYVQCWGVHLLSYILDFVTFLTLRAEQGEESPTIPGFLGYTIISLLILALRVSIAALYTALLCVAQNRRARYFWSLSFWDVSRARKTLSNIPFYAPWYFLAFDAAMLAGAVAVYISLWGVSEPLFVPDKFLFRFQPYMLLFEYGWRLVKHLFLRMQWFLSTIEYRGPRNPRRLRARLIASILRYVVSSLQRNMMPFLLVCMTGCLGWGMLSVCFVLLKFNGSNRDWIFILVIVVMIIGSLPLVVTLFFVFTILRDLVREAVRIFGRNGWAWRETGENEDGRIALV